jgi:predicted DNA-binding helix-hairpin-helix protein
VRLAPEKRHAVVHDTMRVVRERSEAATASRRTRAAAPRFAPAGQSTQMIVGAGSEHDADILAVSSQLYAEHRLRRVYYSAFSPFQGASAALPATAPPLVREHRLYQADWLMRFYGFDVGELTTASNPDLDLTVDPKLAWALRHPEAFPVDVNTAARERLLRVPGLGRRTVERVLQMRRWHRLRTSDLAALRVSLRKVRPFLVTADSAAPARLLDRADLDVLVQPRQQSLLFDAQGAATSGEF